MLLSNINASFAVELTMGLYESDLVLPLVQTYFFEITRVTTISLICMVAVQKPPSILSLQTCQHKKKLIAATPAWSAHAWSGTRVEQRH